jgi:hypothetical protein
MIWLLRSFTKDNIRVVLVTKISQNRNEERTIMLLSVKKNKMGGRSAVPSQEEAHDRRRSVDTRKACTAFSSSPEIAPIPKTSAITSLTRWIKKKRFCQ